MGHAVSYVSRWQRGLRLEALPWRGIALLAPLVAAGCAPSKPLTGCDYWRSQGEACDPEILETDEELALELEQRELEARWQAAQAQLARRGDISAEACAESCPQDGRCEFSYFFADCVATERGCADSESCAEIGNCEFRAPKELGEFPSCIASAASCEQARMCKRGGGCTLAGEHCVAPDGDRDCGSDCRAFGECELVEFGRSCVATEDGCRHAEACQRKGACVFSPATEAVPSPHCTVDERSCADSELCRTQGSCAALTPAACEAAGRDLVFCPRQCHVTTAADCEQATTCTVDGLCGFQALDQCVATKAGCAASAICADEGRCSFRDGECVARTNRECEASSGCANEGRCHAFDGSCITEDEQACSCPPPVHEAATAAEEKQRDRESRRCRERGGAWSPERCSIPQ